MQIASKLPKLICGSKLGRTGRKHKARHGSGANQGQFPVNLQGYKGDFQFSEPFFPPDS